MTVKPLLQRFFSAFFSFQRFWEIVTRSQPRKTRVRLVVKFVQVTSRRCAAYDRGALFWHILKIAVIYIVRRLSNTQPEVTLILSLFLTWKWIQWKEKSFISCLKRVVLKAGMLESRKTGRPESRKPIPVMTTFFINTCEKREVTWTTDLRDSGYAEKPRYFAITELFYWYRCSIGNKRNNSGPIFPSISKTIKIFSFNYTS